MEYLIALAVLAAIALIIVKRRKSWAGAGTGGGKSADRTPPTHQK